MHVEMKSRYLTYIGVHHRHLCFQRYAFGRHATTGISIHSYAQLTCGSAESRSIYMLLVVHALQHTFRGKQTRRCMTRVLVAS